MASKKVLVVFGATGNQGGSVVNSILSDPAFSKIYAVRAVTRNKAAPAAEALKDLGAHIVEANLNDKSSLRKVMKGAYAVFAITNFVELGSMDAEIEQGRNVADVSKELGIRHLIRSTLPNVSKVTSGKYDKVYAFDGKAHIEEYIRQLGIPATFLAMGCFFTFPLLMLSPDSLSAPGAYKLDMPIPPGTKWALISANTDTGKFVKAILANRDTLLGKQIPAAVKEYTVEEIAQILTDKGGIPVQFQQISVESFKRKLAIKGFPKVAQDTITQAQLFGAEKGFLGGLETTWKDAHNILLDPLETFEDWVAKSPLVASMR